MSILSDKEIRDLCIRPQDAPDDWKPMLENFVDHQMKEDAQGNKVISYGLSSYGYDLRIAPEFKIFTNINSSIIDPKCFDEKAFKHIEADNILVPPNSFVLTRSLEKFNMPRDVTGIILGKSTLARSALNCLATPAEAGWSGYLTLEYSNTSSLPVRLYANEGGCQVIFFKGTVPPMVSYADRAGKYHNQEAEIVLPIV